MIRIMIPMVVALALATDCRRAGPPAAEYTEAREKLSQLRKERAVDAYFDPRIREVVDLLSQVDPDSVDAQAAAELKKEIETARADRAAAEEAERRAIEAARTPPPMPASPSGSGSPALLSAPTASPEPQKKPPPEDPTAGMSEAEFKERFSRCFEYKMPTLAPSGVMGEAFVLKDIAACRDRHGSAVGRIVVLGEGKVQAVLAASAATEKKFQLVDGKLVPVPPEAEKKP